MSVSPSPPKITNHLPRWGVRVACWSEESQFLYSVSMFCDHSAAQFRKKSYTLIPLKTTIVAECFFLGWGHWNEHSVRELWQCEVEWCMVHNAKAWSIRSQDVLQVGISQISSKLIKNSAVSMLTQKCWAIPCDTQFIHFTVWRLRLHQETQEQLYYLKRLQPQVSKIWISLSKSHMLLFFEGME